MRAQEFIIENADQAAVDALLKKHGWSMGRTVNGDLAFTWQGNTYVLYGERMRINWPNGQSVSVVWGHKPDWQGRGNEVSYAQAVQKKYLTFDLPIWQALDRGQIKDPQAMQRFKAENERQAREAIAQGMAEGYTDDDIETTKQFKNAIAGLKAKSTIDKAKDGAGAKYYSDGAKVTPQETTRRAAERKAQKDKKGVAEGKLSVDVPNEDWLQDKIDYAKSKGRNSFGVPYMGSTTAAVRGTPPRVRVMRLASLPGMRNEQMNVRRGDLKWLMDYMDKTGKLPPMGSNPDAEYLPYIMVAYNGEAWVNEGNHRIMAAYRLNWPDLPIEIRYFDGGERIEDGPMAPGKIGLA